MANERQAPQQMHPAAVACEFMSRTDLKGGEVDVYAQTFNWLQGILQGETLIVPAEVHEAQTKKLAAYEEKFGPLEEEKAPEGDGLTPPEGVKVLPGGPSMPEAHRPPQG